VERRRKGSESGNIASAGKQIPQGDLVKRGGLQSITKRGVVIEHQPGKKRKSKGPGLCAENVAEKKNSKKESITKFC